MKTNKLIKGLVASVLALSFLSTVACSDSDTKKRVAVTPGVQTINTGHGTTYTTCQDCGQSQYVSSAVGNTYQNFYDTYQFRLNFFLVNESSNAVAVDGQLDLFNLTSAGNCGFLPGTYQVATVNSEFGQLNGDGSVSGLSIEAYNGQEVIRMKIKFASFNGFTNTYVRGCDGANYPDSLVSQIQIESLNGQSCQLGNGLKTLFTGTNQNFNKANCQH